MNKQKKYIMMTIMIILFIVILLFFCINKQKIYIVKFESYGGTVIKNQEVKKGNKVIKPNIPIKDGYDFLYWKYNEIEYNFDNPVNNDMLLKAVYSKKKETSNKVIVKFNTYGGTIIPNQDLEKGTKIILPANPIKLGYEFKGWKYNDIMITENFEVNDDMELEAVWEISKKNVKKYTVRFDTKGGNNISSQIIEEGKYVVKPNNPIKKGYNFEGWTLNGKNYNFKTKVNTNITLVAKWNKIEKVINKEKYIVSFDTKGGSNIASQTIEEGNKALKPTNPKKLGYNFEGWFLNDKVYDFNSLINSNITLVAKWNEKIYIIKAFKVDDYSPDRTLNVYEDGTKIQFSVIKYNDGTKLCEGINPTVNKTEIEGVKNFKVVLTDGREVNAKLN